VSWTEIEDAIYAWVSAASSPVPAVWAGQIGERPDGPYVSMQLASFLVDTTAMLQRVEIVDPDPGEEIEDRATTRVRAVLRLQSFGGAPSQGGTPGIGPSSPVAVLSRVLAAADLPSRSFALNSAGVGVGDRGAITSLAALLGGAIFEPRSVADIRLTFTARVSELSTYVDTVELNRLSPVAGQAVVTAEDL
jgi:hypothetical protein